MNSGRVLVNNENFYIGNSSNGLSQIAKLSDVPKVIDSLTSTSSVDSLSANQGRYLSITHNFKTYSSLAQIGISNGQETIQGIFEALSDQSILIYMTADSNNPDEYPDTRYGTCIAIRYSASRLIAFFIPRNVHRLFMRTLSFTHSEDSGWLSFDPTLYGTEDPNDINLANGNVYFQYEA